MTVISKFQGYSSALMVALLAVSGTAVAEDLVFTLTNASSVTLTEFYASPINVAHWENDILGSDVLFSGESTEITIGDGRTQCEYDFRFVTDQGVVVERAAVNICELGSYTLYD